LERKTLSVKCLQAYIDVLTSS